MEVHLAQRTAVHFGFGLTQSLEDLFGKILLAFRQPTPVDHLGNVVQMPMRMFLRMMDGDLGCAKRMPFDFGQFKPTVG